MVTAFDQRPRRARLGRLLFVCAVMAIGLSSAATQFVAWRFDYHPELGTSWFGKIYAPWRWIEWHQRFRDQGSQTFQLLFSGMALIGHRRRRGAARPQPARPQGPAA